MITLAVVVSMSVLIGLALLTGAALLFQWWAIGPVEREEKRRQLDTRKISPEVRGDLLQ